MTRFFNKGTFFVFSLFIAGAIALVGCGRHDRLDLPANSNRDTKTMAAEPSVSESSVSISAHAVEAVAPPTPSLEIKTNAVVSVSENDPSPPPIPKGKPLSFHDALATVRTHYPELKKQHARLEEALAEKTLGLTGFLPRIQTGLTGTRTDNPVGAFSAKLEQANFSSQDFEIDRLNHPKDITHLGASVRVEVPIFDAFQTIARFRTASRRLEGAQASETFTRQETVLVGTEAYLRAILARHLHDVTAQVLQSSDKDLEEANALMQKGLILGADFYSARVTTAKIRQMLHSSVAAEQVADAALNILMGDPPSQAIVPTGKIPASLPETTPPDIWVESALQGRSDLAALHASVAASKSELGREKARLLPSISAFAEGQQNSRDFGNTAENYTVGVKGTLDLFDPAYSSRVKAAEARFNQLEQDEAALKDQVAKIVMAEVAGNEALHRNFPSALQAGEDAGKAAGMTAQLYREGRKSIADLQMMRMMDMEEQAGLQQLKFDLEMSRIKLLFFTGQLDDTALDEIARRIDGETPSQP